MDTRNIQADERQVSLDPGAELFILDAGGNEDLSLIVGAGSRLFYLAVFKSDHQAHSFKRSIMVGPAAQVASACLWLQPASPSLAWSGSLAQESELVNRSLYILADKQQVEIAERYELQGQSARGRFLSSGWLKDQARLRQSAEVVVAAAAENSDSRIDNQLVLLSAQAQGSMRPALKISAHQVKAGHGASTLLLGADDLFYLQSRGLSETAAKRLLVLSAAAAFVRDIPDQPLADRLLDDIMKQV